MGERDKASEPDNGESPISVVRGGERIPLSDLLTADVNDLQPGDEIDVGSSAWRLDAFGMALFEYYDKQGGDVSPSAFELSKRFYRNMGTRDERSVIQVELVKVTNPNEQILKGRGHVPGSIFSFDAVLTLMRIGGIEETRVQHHTAFITEKLGKKSAGLVTEVE